MQRREDLHQEDYQQPVAPQQRSDGFYTIMAYVMDFVISAVVTFLIIVIINIFIGAAINNGWFGEVIGSQISQLWPDLMVPGGVLIAILMMIHHRP